MRIMLPYPPSANRMWRRSGYTIHLSREGHAYKQQVAWLAIAAGLKPQEGPMVVDYVLHPRQTKAGKESKTRIDLGNCEKVASDALNGVAWRDDKQLVSITLRLGEALPEGGLSVTINAPMERG